MAEIGKILKEARIRRGLSIDEVQKKTKIQKKYLEALEEDDFQAMPGTFYVRTFLRQYAKAVEIDGDKLVAYYDKQFSPNSVDIAAFSEKNDNVSGSRTQKHKVSSSTTSLKSKIPVIILSVLVVVILGAIIFITMKDRQNNQMITTPSTVDVEEVSQSSKVTSDKATDTSSSSTESSSSEEEKAVLTFVDSTSGEANMTLTGADTPVSVEFEGVNGSCWVGILVNGAYTYQYSLTAGVTQSTQLPANTANATLVLGASSNVKVKVNGLDMNFNPNNTSNVKLNVNLTIQYKSAT